ncbi:hypothetical protein E2C01_042007 [Portunus trituberculatus]|uniref:Uncharacterized protein n=1 Tax=Portunus trituberculatus TaxID=210409 RepID=A0A5B7FSI9_PORTR|nr:hypothetical protein [Portunus trituberculatus]
MRQRTRCCCAQTHSFLSAYLGEVLDELDQHTHGADCPQGVPGEDHWPAPGYSLTLRKMQQMKPLESFLQVSSKSLSVSGFLLLLIDCFKKEVSKHPWN